MGRYSLFLQSSGAPGGPNSHQSGGCFSFTVTLHTCNSPETLASVPNSPGILVFSRTKCYAYGLATVKNSYLLNVCLLNVPGDAVCRYTQNPSRFLLLVFHNSRKPQDSIFFPFALLPLNITYISIAFYFWNHGVLRAHLVLKLLQEDRLQPLLFSLLIISARVYEFLAQSYWTHPA